MCTLKTEQEGVVWLWAAMKQSYVRRYATDVTEENAWKAVPVRGGSLECWEHGHSEVK